MPKTGGCRRCSRCRSKNELRRLRRRRRPTRALGVDKKKVYGKLPLSRRGRKTRVRPRPTSLDKLRKRRVGVSDAAQGISRASSQSA